jgi:integrase
MDESMETDKWLWQPRPDGPIFLRLSYRDLEDSKKQFTCSLGTNHWPAARKIRDTDFSPIIHDMGKDRHQLDLIHKLYPELQTRLEDLGNRRSSRAARNGNTLAELCAQWSTAMNKRGGNFALAKSTASRYTAIGASFASFAGNDKPAQGVDPNDLVKYRDSRLNDYGRSKKSVQLELIAIRGMFAFAMDQHGLEVNPATGVSVKRTKNELNREKRVKKRRPPTHTEADAICLAFPGPHKPFKVEDYQDYAMFARYTGLRQGEIAQIHRGDFQLYEAGEFVDRILRTPKNYERPYQGAVPDSFILCLYVADTESRGTKTGLERIVPVADKLLPVVDLQLARSQGKMLFPFAAKDGCRTFGRTWLKRVKKVDDELTMHGFRHYAASEMENNGVSEAVSSIILGHVKDDIHDRYFHKQIRVLKEAVDKIY